MNTSLKLACLAVAGLSCLLFTGCASATKSTNMVPTSFECPTRHAGSVRVTIDGGKKTNPMLATQISHEDFVQATGEAISRSGLFQSVAQGNDETYLLAVKLEDRNGLQNSDRQLIKRSGVRSIDT